MPEDAPEDKELKIAAGYDTALFVAREEAIEWVRAKVQRWKKGQQNGSPEMRFWRTRHRSSDAAYGDQVLGLIGEPGVGKTWFLRYLAEDDRDISPLALYLDLRRRSEFASPGEYIAAVEKQIEERCGTACAVLLVDSIPPTLDDHLRALEDNILRPHVMKRGSLVIMAWAHPSKICWHSPTLRAVDKFLIRPFEESRTRRQVLQLYKAGKLRMGLGAPTIHRLSDGLPLLNYLLATRGKISAFESFLQYRFLRIPAGERLDVWNCMQAVCVLDVLEQPSIQRALETYNQYRLSSRRIVGSGKVLDTLQKHWMTQPIEDLSGSIALVESVRRATKEILKDRDADLYVALEAVARDNGDLAAIEGSA